MPRARPRPSYHHGDLRRALLDAALALVESEGLSALSLREVAKRAGVTHGAPYHHFADRGAMMAAIANEGFDQLRDAMRAAADQAGESPEARLAAIGRAYVHFALEHPAHFRVMFRPELAEGGPIDIPSMPGGPTAFDVLERAIRDCQHAGLAPDADHVLLVASAWSIVHGLAALLLDGPLRLPMQAKGHAMRLEELAHGVPTLFAAMFARAGRASPVATKPRAPRK